MQPHLGLDFQPRPTGLRLSKGSIRLANCSTETNLVIEGVALTTRRHSIVPDGERLTTA